MTTDQDNVKQETRVCNNAMFQVCMQACTDHVIPSHLETRSVTQFAGIPINCGKVLHLQFLRCEEITSVFFAMLRSIVINDCSPMGKRHYVITDTQMM